jgi:fructokinase
MTVVCFGELLIDFVALESGVTVGEASGFLKAPGGAPANVAAAVQRLGVQAAFLGQVGEDPFGRYLESLLRGEGIDTRGLRFSPGARTALAFVSLASDGDRSFAFYRNPSADMLMTPDALAHDVIETAEVFHFGSITLIDDPVKTTTLTAVEAARARGALISYDPNLRMALWPHPEAARAGMMVGLPYAHIVKVSDEELVFLTGAENPAALWHDEMELLLVTHGAGGATLYTPAAGPVHVPGFSVHAVDTTGAGDAFVAGVLVERLRRGPAYLNALAEVGRFANAVGALTTTRKGAIPALPTRAQAEAFLAEHA